MMDAPGKFKGEPALVELAYAASMDGYDEETGRDGGIWYRLLRGPIDPDEECTDGERADLATMLGVILGESGQGFVGATWYGPDDTAYLESDWDACCWAVRERARTNWPGSMREPISAAGRKSS